MPFSLDMSSMNRKSKVFLFFFAKEKCFKDHRKVFLRWPHKTRHLLACKFFGAIHESIHKRGIDKSNVHPRTQNRPEMLWRLWTFASVPMQLLFDFACSRPFLMRLATWCEIDVERSRGIINANRFVGGVGSWEEGGKLAFHLLPRPELKFNFHASRNSIKFQSFRRRLASGGMISNEV